VLPGNVQKVILKPKRSGASTAIRCQPSVCF
jgi:hypothetical protein